MALPYATTADDLAPLRALSGVYPENIRTDASAVSWGAIVAGGAATAALSLILLMLGTGLELSSVSPWAHNGVSAATFGVSTILWVTLTQLVACAMAGCLAGRLRTKWAAMHTHEVYFSDTAHGFLAWAVASRATVASLTSVIGAIVPGGVGVQAGASMAGPGMVKSDSNSGPMGYFIDSLFRKDMNAAVTASTGAAAEQALGASRSEVTRTFMNTVRTDALPAEDFQYGDQLVAKDTGLTQRAAQRRVSDPYARVPATLRDTETGACAVAEEARKASDYAASWPFISLLTGAFVASLDATYGGRRRDI